MRFDDVHINYVHKQSVTVWYTDCCLYSGEKKKRVDGGSVETLVE